MKTKKYTLPVMIVAFAIIAFATVVYAVSANDLTDQPDGSVGTNDNTVYYDNLQALATDEERQAAALLENQERLADVISQFANVEEASLNIYEGSDGEFRASVFVKMNSGENITDEQIEAISSLVSNSVQGLEKESVAVISSYVEKDVNSVGSIMDSTIYGYTVGEADSNDVVGEDIPIYGNDDAREVDLTDTVSNDVTAGDIDVTAGDIIIDEGADGVLRASVSIRLSGGEDLTDEQIDALRARVSNSVQGLEKENVVVTTTEEP